MQDCLDQIDMLSGHPQTIRDDDAVEFYGVLKGGFAVGGGGIECSRAPDVAEDVDLRRLERGRRGNWIGSARLIVCLSPSVSVVNIDLDVRFDGTGR